MNLHPTTKRRSVAAVAAMSLIVALISVVPSVVATASTVAPAVAAAAAPSPGSITLHVQSARDVNTLPGFVHKGDAVTEYKWLINEDDTGDPGSLTNQGTENCLPSTAAGGNTSDPNYADMCQWPSVRNTSGLAPIVAQGDQTDLNGKTALANLPGGKYLISVTADGFKIDGQHFTVNGDSQEVIVEMNPTPLPLTTLRIEVFNDNTPVDATYEVDAEKGLAGFTAHLSDVMGTVSTDYYGNALCTKYMHTRANGSLATDAQQPNRPIAFADGKPVIDPASTGVCTSDKNGLIVIPNMGPNRFAATITPPAGQAGWVQTTTLEGGHDHDIWSQEGATGFDTEQTKGAELVPSVQFGFVRTQAITIPRRNVPTGEIKGVAIAGLPYIGGQNGQVVPETGFAGAKSGGPIKQPWIALSDLGAGDAQIYVGRGNDNGSFDIKNVPDGTYQLSIWDDDQDYILWSFNVEVSGGEVTDVGNKMLVGWFTHIHGNVFIDDNGNGKQDPGEKGVPQFGLTVRERDNSLMDQATNTVSTDNNGAYNIAETYPLGKWLVLEAFNTRYKTTGITYKGENETSATTQIGSLVDLDFLPIIGLGGEINWGVQPYNNGGNGGIVGTVTYDTTRNELDPADAATEPYQPGIPDIPVNLYLTMPCTAEPADQANECRQGHAIVPLQVHDPGYVPDPTDQTAPAFMLIKNPAPDRGAFVKGPLVQDTVSENWAPPRGCTARQYDGEELLDQQALPRFGTEENRMCVEAPMMGVATGPSDTEPNNAGQTVNGNYGFGTSKINLIAPSKPGNPTGSMPLYAPLHCKSNPVLPDVRDSACAENTDYDYPEQDLPALDYIVSVDIPTNPVGGEPDVQGH